MSKSSENCGLVTFTEKIFNETLHFCAMENERNTLLIIRVAHHVFLTLKHIRTSQQQVPLKFSKDFYKPLLFILQNLSSYVLMCCELKYSLVDTRCAITLGHKCYFPLLFFSVSFSIVLLVLYLFRKYSLCNYSLSPLPRILWKSFF